MTSRSGCAYGSGRSTTPRSRLNTPAADPVPNPSATIAAIVKLGDRRSVRNPNRRSFRNVVMLGSPESAPDALREGRSREGRNRVAMDNERRQYQREALDDE